MRRFAIENPKSKFAIPSATLVLDTYIASSDWDKLNDFSMHLLQMEVWRGTEFSKRLYGLAADSDFKKTELLNDAGDFKGALEHAEAFLEKYPNSSRVTECLALCGQLSITLGDDKLASKYLTRLVHETPQSESAVKALLSLAKIDEDHLAFSSASRGYQAFLAVEGKIQSDKRNPLALPPSRSSKCARRS